MTKILQMLPALVLFYTLAFGQTDSLHKGGVTTNVVPGDSGGPTDYMKTDLIPASPNAASLGRFGEVPVNLSTGSAQLSIPLFTVTGTDLSLPVTLNYSYDGYKPAQPVGWVGIGWSLNAGGVISRTIKGRVDNTASGIGYYDYDSQYVQDTLTSYPGASIDFLDRVARGKIDAEPDIYSFNFGNYSGKFIIFNNNFYCFPVQKFKISKISGGFKIITDDGVQYSFTETETSKQKTSYGVYNIPDHISSWYLTRITNPAGTENITLTYTAESQIPQEGAFTQTLKTWVSSNSGNHGPESPVLSSAAMSYPTWVTPKRLLSIASDKYSVAFNAADRTDLPGTAALTGISVYGSDFHTVKRFVFKQSYAGSLKLDTLIEIGKIPDDVPGYDNSDANKYVFNYYGTSFGHNNYAWTDHYGYYTGLGDFNGILIPDYLYPSGPNRSPLLGGTMMGAISKVTYPTGGYTTFEYELNKKYSGQSYTGQNTTKSLVINRPVNNVNGLITSAYKSFSITTPQTVSVLIARTAKNPNTFDNLAKNTYQDFEITGNGATISDRISLESENGGKTFTYSLTPGTYTFVIFCDEKENMISGALTYKLQNNTPVEGETVGGLRIKKLVSYPLTGQPITKEYSYTSPNGFSSGVSKSGGYSQKSYQEINSDGGFLTYTTNYLITNSTIGENYYMGVPHYYTSVLESVNYAGKKFSTRTYFQAFDDNMGIETAGITKYKTDTNGALVRIDSTQNIYRVIMVGDLYNALHPEKTMEAHAGADPLYNYSATGYRIIPSFKYLESTTDTRYEGGDTIVTVSTNGYDLAGSRNLLWTKTKNSRGRELITRYKYPESYTSTLNSNFISANMLSPVWEQQTWSRSGSDSVLIKASLTQYNSSNLKPVRVSSLSGNNIKSLSSETKDVNGKYNTLVSDSAYEPRVDYTYDASGKIIRQQLTGGVPVSYKWEYPAVYQFPGPSTNKNYVTAECRNALETEFFYEGFENDTTTVTGTAHTGVKYKAGAYTVNWTRPNSRNYVISYFYLSGGKWVLSPPQAYTTSSLVLTGGTAYDDVRIYPADAQMNSYTILPGTGMSGMIDAKGLTSYYEYDAHGRLRNVKDQDGNIVKNTDYRYAGLQLTGYGAGPYSNAARSVTFTRSNCDIGETGLQYTYTVPAGRYAGSTQAEADAYAQADLDVNGQATANRLGGCDDQPVE